MTDSAAEAIREAWHVAIREVENFPEAGGFVEQIGRLTHALGRIADLGNGEVGEAVKIAQEALGYVHAKAEGRDNG